MSKKSSRPGKKVALPSVPRPMSEIEADYGRLISQAGQAQYNVAIYSQDLERINDSLRSLNYEAAARKDLDAKAAPPAAQPESPQQNESAGAQ